MPTLPRLPWRRGLGLRGLDEPDKRDWDIDKLGLASSGLGDEHSLRRYCGAPIDQNPTNVCVSCALGKGARVRRAQKPEWQAAPEDEIQPSILYGYFNSRAWHGGERWDLGTYLRTYIKGAVRFGLVPERLWPFSARQRTINKRPPWNAYRHGHDYRGPENYYRIFDRGAARIRAIKAAINAGYPVAFGTAVTYDFVKDRGPVVEDRPTRNQDIAGLHAMLWVGYSREGFLTLQSYGAGYRDGGFVTMTEDYARWDRTADIWVVQF